MTNTTFNRHCLAHETQIFYKLDFLTYSIRNDTMNAPSPKFAILVGGGPAPGINSVIEAATIRSRLCGVDVVGIEDGFKWLMKGDLSHTQPLTRQTAR